MNIARRAVLLSAPMFAATARAQGAPLRCAVGPFQPTVGDARRADERSSPISPRRSGARWS